MRQQPDGTSAITEYLNWMRSQGDEGAEAADLLHADIQETFKSETGLRVLILMEKSVNNRVLPDGSSEGALREHNAIRNFVHDLRRNVAHG